ncbi:hypothetical protein [Phaeobacter gallaeciensis]|uniref:hypothetical protein n=1 Tax=Rhodobacterales TaxID=204455 RepID=UPI00237F08BC|nr:hypothetical protein [Phaeobacter gallaeciensis]MDE4116555.1 hypothetical protein [Phaeobacter gallaeciensis]MDE4121158.1 hypothetical protein [Phaeobacter gallaeciensis]MDE4142004.1 hypothetical protein [Phaeobacter gallaeciensis]MDE4154708.1 hypothetical protein [Phaeobacter gallaeciensis]MDE4230099.1 hypothetical protein [Phaeobacter gallaeciensis]
MFVFVKQIQLFAFILCGTRQAACSGLNMGRGASSSVFFASFDQDQKTFDPRFVNIKTSACEGARTHDAEPVFCGRKILKL